MKWIAHLICVISVLWLPTMARADLLGVGLAFNGGGVFRINEATGETSLLSQPGIGQLTSLARNNSGAFYTVGASASDFSLYTIDPVRGATSLVAPLNSAGGGLLNIQGLAFSSAGVLYASSPTGSTNSLYTINVATAELTLIGSTGQGIGGLEFAADGTLYGVGAVGSGLGLVTLDPLSGSIVSTLSLGNLYNSLTFAPDGTLYAAGTSVLWTVDPASGAIVPGSERGFSGSPGTVRVSGIQYVGPLAAEPIPEPATLVLLGTGLAGIGAVVRKRRTAGRNDKEA